MTNPTYPATQSQPAAQNLTSAEAIEQASARGWLLFARFDQPTYNNWFCRGIGNRLLACGRTAGEAYESALRSIGGAQ